MRARKMEKPTLKNFLTFQEIKLFNSKFKDFRFFQENPFGIFITVSSDVFISPLIFTIVFGCLHCWLHFFTSPTLGFFITVSSGVFISPLILLLFFVFSFHQLSLPWLFFVRYAVVVLLYYECYGLERAFFTLRRFLPYTPFRHLVQPAFIKTSLGPAVLP